MSSAPRLIRIAHSPDSDDAYMFWAIKHGLVSLPGYAFSVERRDIEELNQLAVTGAYDITAVSFHAYAYLHECYDLLASGASFAEKDYGPMLVAKTQEAINKPQPLIAVPGAWTTACLLLKLLLPHAETRAMSFDKIMDAVLAGEVDAGLLIHEGQMQYAEQGLVCVAKMLDVWNGISAKAGKPGLPLPLGGNAIRKDLGEPLTAQLASLMHESIACARAHHEEARNYALSFKRELTDTEADLYLSWYANERTLDMGQEGRDALTLLYDAALTRGLLPQKIIPEIL